MTARIAPLAAIAAALAFGSLTAAAGLHEGLLAAYFFNDDASDLSGRNGNGQAVDVSFVPDRYGVDRAAARFNGASSWIGTPVSGKHFPLTLAFWLRLERVAGPRPLALVDSGLDTSFGHSFNIGVNSGALNAHLSAPFAFQGGEWTHVAVCYDATLRVYVNGRLSAERPYEEGEDFVAGNFHIGKHAGSDPRFFQGCIDDVLIYSRALSSNEVAEIHRHGDRLEAGIRLAAQTAALFAQPADSAAAAGDAGAASTSSPRPALILTSGGQAPATNVWDMVDGNPDTFWAGREDAQGWWIAMAFDPPVRAAGVDVRFADDSCTNVQHLASMDAAEWMELDSSANALPVEARFLWMLFQRAPGDAPLAIRDVRVAPAL